MNETIQGAVTLVQDLFLFEEVRAQYHGSSPTIQNHSKQCLMNKYELIYKYTGKWSQALNMQKLVKTSRF